MDGTLTVPVHDFDAMRRELGLPFGLGTLEGLAALPPEERKARRAQLDEIGWRYVALARPQSGALELLESLKARGGQLGLVTRNGRRNTLGTLERIGCAHFFAPESILTRDEAEPKPSPQAVLRLLTGWGASPHEGVMVGDAVYDVQAGRAAGTATVLIDPDGSSEHRVLADFAVQNLHELQGLLS